MNPAAHLDERGLLQALQELLERPDLLNDWERDFARGVTTRYVRNGMTWLQRSTARKIVGKVMVRLAVKHGREDLVETATVSPEAVPAQRMVPAPALTPPVPAPALTPPVPAPAPAPKPRATRAEPLTPRVLAAKPVTPAKTAVALRGLSAPHLRVLTLLEDGEWHRTSTRGGPTLPHGHAAKTLERHGCVERRDWLEGKTEARITPLGRRVREELEKTFGAASVPAPAPTSPPRRTPPKGVW